MPKLAKMEQPKNPNKMTVSIPVEVLLWIMTGMLSVAFTLIMAQAGWTFRMHGQMKSLEQRMSTEEGRNEYQFKIQHENMQARIKDAKEDAREEKKARLGTQHQLNELQQKLILEAKKK